MPPRMPLPKKSKQHKNMRKKIYITPEINVMAVEDLDQLLRAGSITNTGTDQDNQIVDGNGDDDFEAGAKGWVGRHAWSDYDE